MNTQIDSLTASGGYNPTLFMMDGSSGNDQDNFQMMVDPNSGNLQVFSTTGGLSANGTTNIADGDWHQVYATVEGSDVAYDQYYPNVELLLHLNGANGVTTFTDSSSANRTITTVGSTAVSTDQAKFGPSSTYFAGSNDVVTRSSCS